MTEYRISQEINLFEIADKYAKRLQEQVDEMTLDKAADALAKFGYVKVVRCSDCSKWHHIDTEDGIRYGECDEWKRADSYCVPATNEDGFCAWSARKEVRE